MNVKLLKQYLGYIILLLIVVSCSNNLPPQYVIITEINDLPVDSSMGLINNNPILSHKPLFYSIETQSVIAPEDSASNKWDIKLRFNENNYPQIFFNGGSSGSGVGGVYTRIGILDTLLYANDTFIIQDKINMPAISSLPSNLNKTVSLFNYDTINKFIYPVPNQFLIIRTANRRWAKLEMHSFYKDDNSTTNLNLGFISFRLIYQPNGTPVF